MTEEKFLLSVSDFNFQSQKLFEKKIYKIKHISSRLQKQKKQS